MSMNFSNSLQRMTEVNKLLKELKAKKSEYNSNNSWGFGGLSGDQYLLSNGDKVIIADACFRHIDGHKVAQYRQLVGDYSEPNVTDYYETLIDTANNTDELIEKLQSMLNNIVI